MKRFLIIQTSRPLPRFNSETGWDFSQSCYTVVEKNILDLEQALKKASKLKQENKGSEYIVQEYYEVPIFKTNQEPE